MKKNLALSRLLVGLLLTVLAYFVAMFVGPVIQPNPPHSPRSGVGTLFIIRILIFTFALGLVAGYYQEKHDNHIFAIFVHMAGNLMGLVSIVIRGFLI